MISPPILYEQAKDTVVVGNIEYDAREISENLADMIRRNCIEKEMRNSTNQEICSRTPLWAGVSGTFSIVATIPDSGLVGVAVASGTKSVGKRVPYAKQGVGAVATQAYTNVQYGIKGLQLMEKGIFPSIVLNRILEEDPEREYRQVAMIDAHGNKAAFTGIKAPEIRGESVGGDCIALGNFLTAKETVDRMVEEFERSTDDFEWRLVKALEVAIATGGDRRGEKSAALLVKAVGQIKIEVLVNNNETPVKELCRMLER